jgi:hypothetical protein
VRVTKDITLPTIMSQQPHAKLDELDDSRATPPIAQLKKIGFEVGKSFELDKPILVFARLWKALPRMRSN